MDSDSTILERLSNQSHPIVNVGLLAAGLYALGLSGVTMHEYGHAAIGASLGIPIEQVYVDPLLTGSHVKFNFHEWVTFGKDSFRSLIPVFLAPVILELSVYYAAAKNAIIKIPDLVEKKKGFLFSEQFLTYLYSGVCLIAPALSFYSTYKDNEFTDSDIAKASSVICYLAGYGDSIQEYSHLLPSMNAIVGASVILASILGGNIINKIFFANRIRESVE